LLSAVTTFPVPGANGDNFSWQGSSAHMVTGPDGNIWFTDTGNNQIDRVTPQGQITQFSLPVHDITSSGTTPQLAVGGPPIIDPNPVPPPVSTTAPDDPMPADIVVGPDHALWFTESGVDRIGRITTDGTITEFQTPTANSSPLGLTVGSDHNLWFIESGANDIGRITPAGTITEFPLANLDVSNSDGITLGPGGNVWFVASDTNWNSQIASITPAGKVTAFPISSNPVSLTLGPDGNLWIASTGGEIDRMTADGTVTPYTIPTGDNASSITTGPDGALWFALDGINQLGRITTAGAITEAAVPDPGNSAISDSGGSGIQIGALTTGPDNNLWFVDSYNAQVGNIAVNSALLAAGTNVSVTAGATSSATIGSFVDFAGSAGASAYTASIAWGDGTTSAGVISANSNGGFDVTASRNWSLSDSSATLTITDTRTAGRTAVAYSWISSTPPQPVGTGINVTATTAQLFTGTVASFTNIALGSISSYSATIDWGDGQSSAGTITANSSGGIDVSGSNRFAASGSYTVTTNLSPYPGGFLFPGGGGGIGIHPLPLGGPIAASGGIKAPTAKIGLGKTGVTKNGVAKTTAASTPAAAASGSATGGGTGVVIGGPIIDPLSPVWDGGFASATSTMTVAPAVMDGTGYCVQASTTAPFDGPVASFKLANPNADLSHFHVEVDWSNPSVWDWFTVSNPPSVGTITPDGQGGFTVSTSTTFTDPGWSHFVVKVTDDRLGTGDAALVGIAYGELIVDSPRFWLPILESKGAAGATANTPAAKATSTGASTTAASVNPVLSEQVTATTLALHAAPSGLVAGNLGVLSGVMAGAPKHADLHGTINWGDGTSSPTTLVAGAKGKLIVRGSHRYANTGSYPITVSVQQTLYTNGKASALYPLILPQITQTANVVKPGPITAGGIAIAAAAGQSFAGTIASFTAPATAVPVNRSATILWGDGTRSTVPVDSISSATLNVSGTHTYRKAGKFRVVLVVTQTPAQLPVPRGTRVPRLLAVIATSATVSKSS
jgi:virginiamycin B lyase